MPQIKKVTGAATPLEGHVEHIINRAADGDPAGWLKDLFYGGCVSGHVGELIYYGDTGAFYKKHKAEIQALLVTMMQDLDADSPKGVLRDWDEDDPFCNETSNQNLMAWFAFEETARALWLRMGQEA